MQRCTSSLRHIGARSGLLVAAGASVHRGPAAWPWRFPFRDAEKPLASRRLRLSCTLNGLVIKRLLSRSRARRRCIFARAGRGRTAADVHPGPRDFRLEIQCSRISSACCLVGVSKVVGRLPVVLDCQGGYLDFSRRISGRGADSGCACLCIGGVLGETPDQLARRLIGAQSQSTISVDHFFFYSNNIFSIFASPFQDGQVERRGKGCVYLAFVNQAAIGRGQGAGFGLQAFGQGMMSRTCQRPSAIRQNADWLGFVRITGVVLARGAVTFQSSSSKRKCPPYRSMASEHFQARWRFSGAACISSLSLQRIAPGPGLPSRRAAFRSEHGTLR